MYFHPLQEEIGNMSEEDISKRIKELSRKVAIARAWQESRDAGTTATRTKDIPRCCQTETYRGMAQEQQEVKERTRPRRPGQHRLVNSFDVKHIYLEDKIQINNHSRRRTVLQRIQIKVSLTPHTADLKEQTEYFERLKNLFEQVFANTITTWRDEPLYHI